MYVQYPNTATGFGGDNDEGQVRSWKFTDSTGESDALDAWWALHTAIPEVDSAELLLANPHFITAKYATRLDERLKRSGIMSVAEREITDIVSRLRWCFQKALPVVIYENIVGRTSAEYACHGKGEPSTAI